MMKTLEMMNEAEKTGKTYITGSMRYSAENGFHDSCGEPWDADAFNYINEIMSLDKWRLLGISEMTAKKMTLKDIEERLGYRVELVSL